MREIDATWMRGGTSKCWVFRKDDLEVPDLSVDEVLLRLYGSPDHRQVDGVGGGTSTTSKAVILAPGTTPGIDVEYTFAQVGIEEAKVDWGSNCGNCSAVVASFAIRQGWVSTGVPETAVRVLNTNTDQLILQHVPTPGGRLDEAASDTIPGVPFPVRPPPSPHRNRLSGIASATSGIVERIRRNSQPDSGEMHHFAALSRGASPQMTYEL